ncbi:MAG: PAS domain-containing protein [Immundisolibacteraceae bacterium]|nr:PAS domain-containing protein [Immundisolibacteraceae bacterium]
MKLSAPYYLRFKMLVTALLIEFLTITLITFQGVKMTQQEITQEYARSIITFLPILHSALLLPVIEEDIATLEKIFLPLTQNPSGRVQTASVSNRNGDLLYRIGTSEAVVLNSGIQEFSPGFEQSQFLELVTQGSDQIGYPVTIPLLLSGELIGEVALVFDTRPLRSLLADTDRTGLIVSTIAMLLGGLVFWLMGHRLTQHLKQIHQAAIQVSQGTYKVNIDFQRDDELGQLASAFNQMTQRIQSDRRLQHEQQQNILFTLNSIADAVIAIDPDYKITQINPIAEQLTGWSNGEAKGKPVKQVVEFFNSLNKSTIYPPVCQALESGDRASLLTQSLIRDRSGNFYPVKANAAPILDAEQNIVGAIMVFHDDSDQLLSQRKFMQQQELLASAEKIASMGSWERNLKTNELFWSPGIFRILGLDPALHEASLNLLLDTLPPEDQQLMMDAFDKTIQGEPTEPVIINILRDDLPVRKLELHFHCFYDGPDPIRVIGIARDITNQIAQQQASHATEQTLLSIMDIAPALIVVKSVDGVILHCNKTHADVFGLTPDQLAGKTSYDFHSEKEADIITSRDQQVIQSAERWQLTETLFNGEENRIFHSVRTPLLDESGQPFGILYTGWDITERTEQEQQHRSRVKMEALGKLTGGIAHDYNNMLAIINGYAELLTLQFSSGSQGSNYVDEILRAGRRGAQLTNKLLGFASRQPGKVAPQDLNHLLERNHDLLTETITRRIKLKLDLAESVWPVQIDESEFEDALINLVINASQAMPEGGTLTVSSINITPTPFLVRATDLEPGEYILITFIDDGIGIDSNDIPHISDPFFTTRAEQGAGLGLSQVYGFVRRSGGDIRVISTIGEGTRFELYFPRAMEGQSPATAKPAMVTPQFVGSEQVLVVNNEPALTQLTGEILASQGYQIVAVSTPALALAKLATLESEGRAARVLICDVTMPVMDGVELAAQARKQYPQLKVLFFSGYTEHQTRLSVPGHSDLLNKPFTASELLTKVRTLLDQNPS